MLLVALSRFEAGPVISICWHKAVAAIRADAGFQAWQLYRDTASSTDLIAQFAFQ
jgi:hypothetical protein